MYVVKKEFFVLLRIVASCLTALCLVFFIAALVGEDLFKNNETINKIDKLSAEISHELSAGIRNRVAQLGEVPEKTYFKKVYCVELAKEIHALSNITEKQRILFDEYDVRKFEDQLRRLMSYTGISDSKSLMDELEIVKRELRNSANLLQKKKSTLIRQRTAYLVLLFILWVVLYLYYSRGTLFKKS